MTTESSHRLKVLIVDDHRPVADLLERICKEDASLDALVVYKGFEALNSIKFSASVGHAFDIIITDNDIDSPDQGLEIIKAGRMASDKTVIVLCSATITPRLEDEGSHRGANIVSKKELSIPYLKALVNSAIEERTKESR